MKTQLSEVSVPGPRLPIVVNEITETLLQDDWYRVSTEDGTRKYYVVGADDQGAELGGEADFCRMEFPIPTKPGPLSQWAVRKQLADNKPSHFLASARKNLEQAGVPPVAIDRFLAGADDLSDWRFHSDLPIDERARLVSNFLQADRLSSPHAQSIELDSAEALEADIAREKICLEQLTKKYSKIVDRWEQLEGVPFDDPQLEEASRTFLYGFHRASIVLCASAVETQLRRFARQPSDRPQAFDLIESAEREKLIGPDIARYAKDLFSYRNRVAHEGVDPSHDKAKEILGLARMLVGKLRG